MSVGSPRVAFVRAAGHRHAGHARRPRLPKPADLREYVVGDGMIGDIVLIGRRCLFGAGANGAVFSRPVDGAGLRRAGQITPHVVRRRAVAEDRGNVGAVFLDVDARIGAQERAGARIPIAGDRAARRSDLARRYKMPVRTLLRYGYRWSSRRRIGAIDEFAAKVIGVARGLSRGVRECRCEPQ